MFWCSLTILHGLARAVTPERCVLAYAAHVRRLERRIERTDGGGVTAGGFSRATSSGDEDGGVTSSGRRSISSTAVFGGSSLGTTADGWTNQSLFAVNLARSIEESGARVAGPVTTRLAFDLNAAVYDESPLLARTLAPDLRTDLRRALDDRRVATAELTRVTRDLAATGEICDQRGRPLTQDAWATAVVHRVSFPSFETTLATSGGPRDL